jgi:hypothetical protein
MLQPRVIKIRTRTDLELKVEYDASSVGSDFCRMYDYACDCPIGELGATAMYMLEPVIISWNIFNDDGTPHCPSHDNLYRMPIYLLYDVLRGIVQDQAA